MVSASNKLPLQHTPHPSSKKAATSITCPSVLYPQHRTDPPLKTAHECDCKTTRQHCYKLHVLHQGKPQPTQVLKKKLTVTPELVATFDLSNTQHTTSAPPHSQHTMKPTNPHNANATSFQSIKIIQTNDITDHANQSTLPKATDTAPLVSPETLTGVNF
jgi:hypothetical protein